MAPQLTWLVTGCSSGLGEAMVKAILSKGDKVIATARASQGISGSERLSALEEAGAAVLELDVTSPQEELDQIAKTVWEVYGHIDVLVNNAGYGESGIMEEMSEELITCSLRANALGPINLTRSFLPMMRARKTGTLLFVGSVSIYYTMPTSGTYIGSKALLEGLATNLAVEVAPFGLRTSILTFGHFRTDLLLPNKRQYRPPNKVSDYEEINSVMEERIKKAHGTWPGDAMKGCELVVDAVRGEGTCSGKELPLRLPVGSDTFGIMRDDLQKRLQVCDEWEDIMSKTDYE
ncbi:uncharacterized protein N7496_009973 [Penicillium cataractarum]|uniref:Uncharacterized protein n=1 Tax=Penicillium cataractarum TaxID=2100454 RepID=A0A9W9RRC1_9EURO|nr:uncharacterized protein N7496_009973 [Penicillium cataractarum]KAJ5364260.1 hypothetical protein N7496_009973 [Penicillium cataractarum]